ncbi:hypothetical protein PENTCL1PPCAC_4631, partial [Pristionchus entomophagus]
VLQKVHTVLLCTLDTTAILANCILLYAIFTRTPASLRSYAILLLNNAFMDICSASASALAIARLIYLRDGPSQLYVYVGPCSLIGEGFCHMCHTAHTYFVSHSTVILLHSFCFRLYILREALVDIRIPTSKTTALISIALYAPSIVVMVSLKLNAGHANVIDYRFVIALTYLVLLSPSAMIMIFLVRRKLLGEIRKMIMMQLSVWDLFFEALTYQLLLPVGQALACTTWLLSVADVWSGEASERLVMTFGSFFALGSPLINLTFLPPYRRMIDGGRRGAKTEG